MKTTLNIIGQFASKASADEFTAIAGRVQGVNLLTHVNGDGWTVDNIGIESMPDVLVLEIDASKADELAFAEATVGRIGNRVNVFVTYREGAIDILRRLMRSGVKDIFQQPFIAGCGAGPHSCAYRKTTASKGCSGRPWRCYRLYQCKRRLNVDRSRIWIFAHRLESRVCPGEEMLHVGGSPTAPSR